MPQNSLQKNLLPVKALARKISNEKARWDKPLARTNRNEILRWLKAYALHRE